VCLLACIFWSRSCARPTLTSPRRERGQLDRPSVRPLVVASDHAIRVNFNDTQGGLLDLSLAANAMVGQLRVSRAISEPAVRKVGRS
jgi:hypothetical protein